MNYLKLDGRDEQFPAHFAFYVTLLLSMTFVVLLKYVLRIEAFVAQVAPVKQTINYTSNRKVYESHTCKVYCGSSGGYANFRQK